MKKYFNNPKFSDIKVKAGDGTVFPAHRIVLAKMVFFEPFLDDACFTDVNNGMIELKLFSGNQVEKLLMYIYGMPLHEVSSNDLMNVLPIAEFIDDEEFTSHILYILSSEELNVEQNVELLKFKIRHGIYINYPYNLGGRLVLHLNQDEFSKLMVDRNPSWDAFLPRLAIHPEEYDPNSIRERNLYHYLNERDIIKTYSECPHLRDLVNQILREETDFGSEVFTKEFMEEHMTYSVIMKYAAGIKQ